MEILKNLKDFLCRRRTGTTISMKIATREEALPLKERAGTAEIMKTAEATVQNALTILRKKK